jgi:hypothetical protein
LQRYRHGLVVVQGEGGIDARGAAGGDVAGCGGDGGEKNGDRCIGERIGHSYLEEDAGREARQHEAAEGADDDAGESELDAVSKDSTEDLRRSCAEGHANADFAGLQADEVGHDAINADERESKAESGEDAEEKSLRARRGVDCGDALVERGDRCNGLIFLDGPDAVLESGDQSSGIGFRSDHEIDANHARGLIEGRVDLRFGCLLGVEMIGFLDVASDADDLAPDRLVAREIGGQALPDSIEPAEIFLGESFIHNEHRGVPFRVAGGEIASGENRNAKGVEEIGCDAIGERGLFGVFGISGGSFGFKGSFRDFVGHGVDESDGGGSDAGSCASAVEDLLDEGDTLLGSREAEFWEVKAESEEMIGAETEIEAAELVETAQRESGTDEENGGEGDFADYQELAEEVVGRGGGLFGGVEGVGLPGGTRSEEEKVDDFRSHEPTLRNRRERWGAVKHF